MRPNTATQLDMVINGLAEILLKASEGDKIVFAFPGKTNSFDANAYYGIDGVTEKVKNIYICGLDSIGEYFSF